MFKRLKQLLTINNLVIIVLLLGIHPLASATDKPYKRVVVIDPGHGGKDSGALGKVSMEKNIVLSIGLKVGAYLTELLDSTKVIYTRTTDVFPALHERAAIANENDADLFVSIHADAVPSPSAYGTSSLVLGLHRADENFEVAKRENSVILMEEDYSIHYENFNPESPESYIIFSLMQNVHYDQSIQFAKFVQDQFRDRAKRHDRGVKQQGLLVLAQTSMPGILIETGFVSNPKEEQFLLSEEGQDLIASAIFRAIREYFNYIESFEVTEPAVTIDNITKDTAPDLKIPTPKIEESPAGQSSSIADPPKPLNLNAIENVTYKVQIITTSKQIPLTDNIFKDFNDVSEFTKNNMFCYAVGSETDYSKIVAYSKMVKNRFPDAFIIATNGPHIIPLQEVLPSTN